MRLLTIPLAPFAPRICAVLLAAALPTATLAQSLPFSGTAVAVPATIEAENFDRGGQGTAYYDAVAGNSGGQYRSEDVDITASCDSAGGGYVVNNFQTGEWLKYTINVPVAGNYDIELRGASNYSGAAFHVEVDGVNATGSIPFPITGGWCAFQWVGKKGVPLAAGTRVLKVYADRQYFDLNSLRVVGPAASTPYSGTPISIPATIEAENFDKGGEGLAYHDNVKGNSGRQYRTGEDVDIIGSKDSGGGGYVVTNFETGEWMKYTINVPSAGNYDLALRTASNFSYSAFHVEVDGANVTGRVTVPYTGNWKTFQWVTAKAGLPLAAGTHQLKVVSDQQYFDLNSVRLTAAAATAAGTSSSTPPSSLLFRSGYEGSTALGPITDCYSNGCWQDIVGTDSTTGHTWPPKVSNSRGRYQLLMNPNDGTTPSSTTMTSYMYNELQTVTGPKGNQTRAMYSQVNKMGAGSTQDPFHLLPTSDVPEFYFSQWFKLQPDLVQKLNSGSSGSWWRDLFEFKTVDTDYRLELQIRTGGGNTAFWMMRGDGWVPSYTEYWRIYNQAIPVPLGQWFKLEVYWKRSSGSDGRAWFAVNGQVLGEHRGPNMGPNNSPINRIMTSQLYSGASFPIYQWVDDLQIWSTFPTAAPGDAWYDPPYAPH